MARKPEQRNAPWQVPIPTTRPQDSEAEARIGRVGNHLRGIYDEVLAERVPNSLEDLLRKLD